MVFDFQSMVRSGGAWRRDGAWRPDVTWRDVTASSCPRRRLWRPDVTWRDGLLVHRGAWRADVMWRDGVLKMSWRDVTWRDATASLSTAAPVTSWRDVTWRDVTLLVHGSSCMWRPHVTWRPVNVNNLPRYCMTSWCEVCTEAVHCV